MPAFSVAAVLVVFDIIDSFVMDVFFRLWTRDNGVRDLGWNIEKCETYV